VKAGTKKRRAKSEQEMIREAVEEHGRRGVRAERRSSKVRSYSYKKPAKKKEPKRKLSLDKTAVGYNDRNRREWQPWEEAILFVDAKVVLDELTKKQIQCDHKALKTERPVAVLGDDAQWRTCPNCQAVLRWWGSYTATIQAEWMSYRVNGYPMTEWGELYTRDKTLWLFVIEEAHASKEDDNDSTR